MKMGKSIKKIKKEKKEKMAKKEDKRGKITRSWFEDFKLSLNSLSLFLIFQKGREVIQRQASLAEFAADLPPKKNSGSETLTMSFSFLVLNCFSFRWAV